MRLAKSENPAVPRLRDEEFSGKRNEKNGVFLQRLRRFKILVRVLSLNDKIVDLSLNDEDFDDFEDGLQYYSAIENDQDVIITRDLKDFKEAKIPVMTAEEYLVSIDKFASS